jgi:hypothetical protein
MGNVGWSFWGVFDRGRTWGSQNNVSMYLYCAISFLALPALA